MAIKRFQRGQQPTFNCSICGRRTRDTTGSDSQLCSQCYDLAGWDNHHNDSGTVPDAGEMKFYESLVAEAAAKGGDADKMREQFDYIWHES